jgi:hypothetical protein
MAQRYRGHALPPQQGLALGKEIDSETVAAACSLAPGDIDTRLLAPASPHAGCR